VRPVLNPDGSFTWDARIISVEHASIIVLLSDKQTWRIRRHDPANLHTIAIKEALTRADEGMPVEVTRFRDNAIVVMRGMDNVAAS
jgi:hypothetical protein